MRLLDLALIALATPGAGVCAQERAPGVKRLSITVEVDAAKARESRGEPYWGAIGAPDEEIVARAARLVQRRFDALQRAARVEREPGAKRFTVSLPSLDERDRGFFEGLLKNMGVCEFFFLADAPLAQARGIDLAAEQARFDAWRKANPDAVLGAYDALAPEEGGPARGLAWFATYYDGKDGPPRAVLLPAESAETFGAADFDRVFASRDAFGYPAIGTTLRDARTEDFAGWTGAHVGDRVAIVLAAKIRSAPVLQSKQVESAVLEGRFDDAEMKHWLDALTTLQGPLRIVDSR